MRRPSRARRPPSGRSLRRNQRVEDDATIQHERAARLLFLHRYEPQNKLSPHAQAPIPIFGSASFSDAAAEATAGVRAICATDAVVPLSASLRFSCSAAVGASRPSSSAGLIIYIYTASKASMSSALAAASESEALVPIKSLFIERANVAHCSGGFAEAVQLRRRYAVMKEAARARRR